MPLPWKKSRVSRFSRIVADLHPPNRGNSLVVETGFPTSLVDLFVKNHERLKKPHKKWKTTTKHQHQHQREEGFIHDLVISDPIPLSSSRDSVGLPEPICRKGREEGFEGSHENFNGCKLVSQFKCADVDAHNNGLNENEKRLFLVILEVLVVVILVLITKKLSVGITMSAFVLIFVEYLGKHNFCFSKPYWIAPSVMETLLRRVSSVLFILKRVKNTAHYNQILIFQEDEEDVNFADSCDVAAPLKSNTCVDEIQVEESYLAMVAQVEENRGTEMDLDSFNFGGRLECFETDRNVEFRRECDDMVTEKECGRRTKLKRTIIKRLVPKKLRGEKKSRMCEEKELDLTSEASSSWGENQLRRIEEVEEHENNGGVGLEEKGRLLPQELQEQGEYQQRVEISISSTDLQAPAQVIFVDERVGAQMKGNSGYLILCVAALAGLLGGRIIALLLTVVSCLMLKLVKRGRGVSASMGS